jgi:hypothetical protein
VGNETRTRLKSDAVSLPHNENGVAAKDVEYLRPPVKDLALRSNEDTLATGPLHGWLRICF